MQLTARTDYAIRTLLFVAMNPGRPVSVDEVRRAFGIERNTVAKVANELVQRGYLTGKRGRGGGLQLTRSPEEIRLGTVVREFEPTFDLLECFSAKTNTCPIAGSCRLERVLHDARAAFFAVLDGKTVADVSLGAGAAKLLGLMEKKLDGSPRRAPR